MFACTKNQASQSDRPHYKSTLSIAGWNGFAGRHIMIFCHGMWPFLHVHFLKTLTALISACQSHELGSFWFF
jgi:hypothetical protein